MTPSALAGKRVVITRPPHKAQSFIDQLRAVGAKPILFPTIIIQPPTDSGPLDRALQHLDHYDWVLITSANTVTHIGQRLDALGLAGEWPPVAVIGPATGSALEKHGVSPALMPETHVAEALFAALQQQSTLTGTRILLPQGNRARPVLADLLREAGATVETVVAYENVPPEHIPVQRWEAVDAITFTSASTAQNFVALFDKPLAVIGNAQVACIGPVTADAARALGLPVHVVAEPHTVSGLIAALEKIFERDST